MATNTVTRKLVIPFSDGRISITASYTGNNRYAGPILEGVLRDVKEIALAQTIPHLGPLSGRQRGRTRVRSNGKVVIGHTVATLVVKTIFDGPVSSGADMKAIVDDLVCGTIIHEGLNCFTTSIAETRFASAQVLIDKLIEQLTY